MKINAILFGLLSTTMMTMCTSNQFYERRIHCEDPFFWKAAIQVGINHLPDEFSGSRVYINLNLECVDEFIEVLDLDVNLLSLETPKRRWLSLDSITRERAVALLFERIHIQGLNKVFDLSVYLSPEWVEYYKVEMGFEGGKWTLKRIESAGKS